MPRAPKAPGHYVPQPWQGSNRRAELPANWATVIVPAVRRRSGGRCERVEDGVRCVERAHSVDHDKDPDSHALSNLVDLCRRHHATKTGSEGARAVRRRGWR